MIIRMGYICCRWGKISLIQNMNKIVLILLCLISTNCYSQSLKDVERVEINAQNCADTTNDVIACEKLHYKQMDSMLNLVYKKLKIINKEEDFKKIKSDQIQWLSLRDKEFKKIDGEKDCNVSTDVCQALLISRKTWVVQQRVEILIKKYNTVAGL